MGNELIIAESQTLVPVQIASLGEEAIVRFIEFFTANIRNPNTRAAYARAVSDFFRCVLCMSQGMSRKSARPGLPQASNSTWRPCGCSTTG